MVAQLVLAVLAQAAVPLPPVLVPAPASAPPMAAPERRDPTGSISIVEEREHAGEAKETAELLATAPGVQLQDNGSNKSISVRGASANGVLVLLDGVPLNSAGSAVDVSRVPSAII